jgi:hypothetical protein
LALRFRGRYCPHQLDGQEDRPVMFEAERVAAVVASFVSVELMKNVSSQLLIDPAHVSLDASLSVLVANVQPTLRRTYAPAVGGTTSQVDAKDTKVAPILTRPDKTYGLAVASNFALDEVFR